METKKHFGPDVDRLIAGLDAVYDSLPAIAAHRKKIFLLRTEILKAKARPDEGDYRRLYFQTLLDNLADAERYLSDRVAALDADEARRRSQQHHQDVLKVNESLRLAAWFAGFVAVVSAIGALASAAPGLFGRTSKEPAQALQATDAGQPHAATQE